MSSLITVKLNCDWCGKEIAAIVDSFDVIVAADFKLLVGIAHPYCNPTCEKNDKQLCKMGNFQHQILKTVRL